MSRFAATDGAVAVHRRLMRLGVAETAVAEPWAERDTSVRAVEAHLARLWTAGDGEDERVVTEKGLPHTRASVLNLIATVADDAAAE
ncbi:MAG TPA: hypothetical protein VI733_03090, partial [Candidatus Limnocylindria bacterium]|nr:hypothetical protein [Candidatus Limnocylindria bacterium]